MFDELRDTVQQEWQAERQRETRERFVRELRSRYEVHVSLPVPARIGRSQP